MLLQRTIIIVTFFVFISLFSFSQKLHILNADGKASFRGLSVVNDRVVWVSGSHGVVGRTTDGGDEWTWIKVPRYETRDFRDIEAFDAATAIIMAVDTPALILRTVDGGENWKIAYENKMPGMFLDAMEFWNDESGIVVGDPVKGKFFIARTFDGGHKWQEISADHLPSADSGEACYAASGTNVRALDRDEACFVSGGSRTRLFWKDAPVDIPFLQTGTTAGANSVAIRHNGNSKPYIIVVGGDFIAARGKPFYFGEDG
ncbi:MAG: YCF48-related protein, partial [Flavitalea sp.]